MRSLASNDLRGKRARALALLLVFSVACGSARDVGLGARCSTEGDCLSGRCLDGRCVAAGVPGCDGSPILGCPCSAAGQLGCNGTAQKLRLVCKAGAWAESGVCDGGENCDRADGACRPVLPGCVGRSAGFAYCDAAPGTPPSAPPPYLDVRRTCGPDLVSDESTEICAGVCAEGACQSPICGDRKLSSGELCDDGNDVPLDGCEPAAAYPPSSRCTPSRVLKLAAGDGHTCALCNGGYVRCWGENGSGELGLGHTTFVGDRHPFQITDASGGPGMVDLEGAAAIDIDAGHGFTCALLDDGAVRCWGRNDAGQLGLQHTTAMPTEVGGKVDLGGAAAIAISAGLSNACAVLTEGSVRCWGDNVYGALGLGNTDPVLIGTAGLETTASAVAASTESACALVSGDGVRCWGDNSLGELGLGNTATFPGSHMVPPSSYGNVVLNLGAVPTSITVGSAYACAGLRDGQAECWGANNVGQLGLGHTVNIGDNEVPAFTGVVNIPTPVISIAASIQFTCALSGNARGLRCWGNNQKGQLGQGDTMRRGNTATTIPSLIPAIRFPAGLGPTAMALGTSYTCAQLSDGSVRCWGANNRGQLGLGLVPAMAPDFIGGAPTETPDQLPPVRVFPP
jgi:cysteine-rich repeat protein